MDNYIVYEKKPCKCLDENYFLMDHLGRDCPYCKGSKYTLTLVPFKQLEQEILDEYFTNNPDID